MRRTILLTILLAAVLTATGAATELPYIQRVVPGFQTDHVLGIDDWHTCGDFDGDGQADLALRHPLGLLGVTWRNGDALVLFQYNFPVEFPVDNRSPLLGPPLDVFGDGRDEIPFIVHSAGNKEWRFRILETHTEAITLDVLLPAGVDARADGKWDGRYFIAGVLPDLAPSGGPLVLVGCVIGFDRYGRGVLALDARTGEILWHYETGPNPTPFSCWTGDLTGDGRSEIVFASNSPDNLGGEVINGTSDDKSWLFVVDADGDLVLRREVGDYFVTPYLRVADLTGDGEVELVVATAYHGSDQETHNQLSVWSAAGDLIAETVVPELCRQIVIVPGVGGSDPWILHGSRANNLRSYRLTGAGLVPGPVAAQTDDTYLSGVQDILPEPGVEILVIRDPLTESPRLQVLDQQLRVMAEDLLPARAGAATSTVWPDGPHRPVLIYATGGFRQALEFLPAPPVPLHKRSGVRIAALGGIFTALLIGYLVRRNRRAAERAATERDLLRRLFQELAESSHGTLAATRGVERLAWLLESHAMSGETDGPVLERLRAGLTDFRETVRPRLREILELAVRHEATVDDAVAAGTQLERFAGRVRVLEADGLDADRISGDLESLQKLAGETTEGFVVLQETVAARFGADPRTMAEQLIAQWPSGIDGVDVHVDPNDAGTPPRARIDPSDLRFVLENMIGNALRSMQDAPAARLTVRCGVVDSRAFVEIVDTGCGIAPADRERIFEPGFSTRTDGGLGLHRSRELLAFWRGRLELLDTEPGVGSTFRIEIPLAPKTNRED